MTRQEKSPKDTHAEVARRRVVSKLIRRTHLLVALFLTPWLTMYAITAVAFNHGKWFDGPDDLYNLSGPSWTKVQTWDCSIDVPSEGEVPREVAAEMLSAAGIEAKAFGAFRSGSQQISAYITEFWETRRLAYDVDSQQLSLYHRRPVLASTLTLMHSRAGYHHDGILNDVWALMVDVTVIGVLLWAVSGITMWWQQPKIRLMGLLSLGAGLVTFAAFLFEL